MQYLIKEISFYIRQTLSEIFTRDEEIEDYIASLHRSYDVVDDTYEFAMRLQSRLNSVNLALSAANTRAAKNGALALLAFGLIAVEILGVSLYFLPR